MRIIAALFLAFVVAAPPAMADEIFNISAKNTWVKTQDKGDDIVQWSIVFLSNEWDKTRVDLVSTVDTGKRTTYYLIRTECPGGGIATSSLGVGKKVGIGVDCRGNLVQQDAAVLDSLPKLPPAAEALLKQ